MTCGFANCRRADGADRPDIKDSSAQVSGPDQAIFVVTGHHRRRLVAAGCGRYGGRPPFGLMFPLIPNGNVAAVPTSGVAQAEHQGAGGEGSGGPQGEHAEALPRRERQSLYVDRVLDVQAGGYRPDLL